VTKKVLRFSLLLGIALFVFLILKTDPAEIFRQIRKLTWLNLAVLLAMRLVYWILRTVCWQLVFVAYDHRLPFRKMLQARLASYAVSYLTPSAMLGGEPLRAFMINGSSRRRSFATVVVDKTIELVTMSVFTVAAVVFVLSRVPMPPLYRTILLAFIIIVVGLVVFLIVRQRQGMFIGVLDVLAKLRLRLHFLERHRANLRDIDAYVSDFYRRHRRKIPLVALHYVLTFLFWILEIQVTMVFLHIAGVTFGKSFLVITLGNVALLLPAIPAAVGVYEAANVGVFAILGWGATTAMSVALVRRIVTLVWVGIGLAMLGKGRFNLKDL